MKTKVDFITNSSTTSFVVMGAYIDPNSIPDELLEELKTKLPGYTYSLEEIRSDIGEFVWDLIHKTDLRYSPSSCYSDPDEDIIVGIPYTKMQEEETLKEFKERTTSLIKDILGIDITPGHIEVAWEDR